MQKDGILPFFPNLLCSMFYGWPSSAVLLATLSTHEFRLPPSATLFTACGLLRVYVLFYAVVPKARSYPSLHFVFSPFPAGEYFHNVLEVIYTTLCSFPYPRRPTAVLLWCSVYYMLLSACMPLPAIQPLLHAGFTSVFASGFLYNFLCVVYMLG